MKGFTFVEFMVAICIIIMIGAIGLTVFYTSRNSKNLEIITDGLEFTLGKAKSEAIAGKNSSNFGVHVASTSYSFFAGSSYDELDPDNKTTSLPDGWQLSTSTTNGSSNIVFLRLTGSPQAMATVTVTNLNDTSMIRRIVIGQLGDISVLK